MVANAHQTQEEEGRKLFDMVYLVGVIGMIVALVPLPFVLLIKNEEEIPYINYCRKREEQNFPPRLFQVAIAFCSLSFFFTVALVLRTRENLRKLEKQHIVNLPSNNALTYLDTLILCSLVFVFFWSRVFLIFLFSLNIIDWQDLFFANNLCHLMMIDIVMSFLFPVYIILKTKRYLPRLWDDNSPIILGNNDFYASRLSQISPNGQTEEIAESRF